MYLVSGIAGGINCSISKKNSCQAHIHEFTEVKWAKDVFAVLHILCVLVLLNPVWPVCLLIKSYEAAWDAAEALSLVKLEIPTANTMPLLNADSHVHQKILTRWQSLSIEHNIYSLFQALTSRAMETESYKGQNEM